MAPRELGKIERTLFLLQYISSVEIGQDDLERPVEPILRNAGLLDFFETVVYGGGVKRLKPAPDPYRLGVERLGVKKALAVEDSAAGIASATAAGLDVCRVVKQSEMTSEVRKHLSHRS